MYITLNLALCHLDPYTGTPSAISLLSVVQKNSNFCKPAVYPFCLRRGGGGSHKNSYHLRYLCVSMLPAVRPSVNKRWTWDLLCAHCLSTFDLEELRRAGLITVQNQSHPLIQGRTLATGFTDWLLGLNIHRPPPHPPFPPLPYPPPPPFLCLRSLIPQRPKSSQPPQ